MVEKDVRLYSWGNQKADVCVHFGFKEIDYCEELDKNNALC